MDKLLIQYEQHRFSDVENLKIARALAFGIQAHDGQMRASGDLYITHPIAVAEIVAGWNLDAESVIAALLHDVVEDTPVTLEEVAAEFGDKVAELVDGVTKLRLSNTPRPSADSVRLQASNENLRKLLLATTKDYRVILIKLADRLHNMRTLGALPPDARMRIARESLEIFGPLADRLGMGQLKGELQDLGFKYSKPDEYADLVKRVKTPAAKAQRYLATLMRTIRRQMAESGVKVEEIEGRQKHYYSIYRKLQKVDGDIDKIYDLIAVRLIVPDVAACYQALGVLHQHYKPLIYRIKDYIAVPKTNGYQSLHTTVFAEEGRITEIQIRTREMHEEAEYGLAAHFFYDMKKGSKAYLTRDQDDDAKAKVPSNLRWVKELADIQRSTGSGQEFVEGVKLELFSGRIFAFSPKGDLYELPEGSTPLDFAFAVHSDLGLRALGAKVNGRMVPLDTKLDNRDVVEIVSRRESAPSRDWLGFVATSHAKGRIRAWFRLASRDANIASGRAELESELQALDIKRLDDLPKRQVAELLDGLHQRSLDDLYALIGEGGMSVSMVVRRIVPEAVKPQAQKTVKRAAPTGRVLVSGTSLPYVLAPCCNPVYPQPIVGFVTRGKGVTVHGEGCRNLPPETERHAKCRWETTGQERLLCQVELRAIDRLGLVSDISGQIADQKLMLAGIATKSKTDGEVQVGFGVEVPDMVVLARVIRKIERLPGVIQVRRVS